MDDQLGERHNDVTGEAGQPGTAQPDWNPAGTPPGGFSAQPGGWQPNPWQPNQWQAAAPQPAVWQPPISWESEAAAVPSPQGGSDWMPPGMYAAPVRFVPARKLASIVTAMLMVSGIIALLRALTYIYGVDLQGRLNTARGFQSDVDFYNRMVGILALASIVAGIICGIAFMRWLWRSVGNGVELGAGYGISSPRMAVVCWFIPIYNLIRPYQIVIELHDRLLAPLASKSGRRVIKTWWALWILGAIVGEVGTLFLMPTRTSTAGVDRLATMAFLSFTAILSFADAILAIAVVRQMQRLADARELARRGQPTAAIDLVTSSQRARVTRVPALLAVFAIVAVTLPLGVVYARASAAPEWIQYQPADKSFTVSMPVAPLEKPIAPSVHSGLVISGDAFQSGERGTLAFVVTYYDYPTGTISTIPTEALDSMQQAAAAKSGSVLDRQVNGRPCRQFESMLTKASVKVIACVDGDRAYVVEADFTAAESGSPDIDRFLNSFTLP